MFVLRRQGFNLLARTSAQERLGNDVKSAGKGDCLKGDYGGTGMGLEADVVLLLDVDGSKWSLEPRNLYVAASRARLRLFVFVKEGVEVPGAAT